MAVDDQEGQQQTGKPERDADLMLRALKQRGYLKFCELEQYGGTNALCQLQTQGKVTTGATMVHLRREASEHRETHQEDETE